MHSFFFYFNNESPLTFWKNKTFFPHHFFEMNLSRWCFLLFLLAFSHLCNQAPRGKNSIFPALTCYCDGPLPDPQKTRGQCWGAFAWAAGGVGVLIQVELSICLGCCRVLSIAAHLWRGLKLERDSKPVFCMWNPWAWEITLNSGPKLKLETTSKV